MKTISLDLNILDEQLTEPDLEPYDANCRYESGYADFYTQTETLSRKEKIQVQLNLSSEDEPGETVDEIQQAFGRFCEVKIARSASEIIEIRHQGCREIGWASNKSVLLIPGSFLVTHLTFLPEVISYLLATGAGINAWVTLWPPPDSTLYEWSPYQQIKLGDQQIKSAQVVLNYPEN